MYSLSTDTVKSGALASTLLCAEAMGAMAHYRAEKQVQRPIPKPMVIDAVKTIDAYLSDPTASHPIPQLDFSMIKNTKSPDKNKGVMKPAGT